MGDCVVDLLERRSRPLFREALFSLIVSKETRGYFGRRIDFHLNSILENIGVFDCPNNYTTDERSEAQ